MKVRCYRGTGVGDARDFDLDPAATLSQVRETLTTARFMFADRFNQIAYRFVAQEAKTSNLIESLVKKNVEQVVPLQAVWGKNKQVIITNQYATQRPDLIGIGVNKWTDRHLTVACRLNNGEPAGQQQNERVQAFEPLMLQNVVIASTDERARGRYDYVCVCTDGSAVRFDLSSWGAAGFEYAIAADAGKPIVDSLYACFGNDQNRIGYTSIGRWEETPKLIEIVGTSQMNLGVRAQAYHKLTFRSRRIWEYKQDGVVYASDARPPGDVQTAASVVPGGGIEAGGAREGRDSDVQFGALDYANTDDWSQGLGQIVVHFFVFRSHADALTTITGYNAAPGMEEAYRPPPDTTPLPSVGLLNGIYRRYPVENDWHTGTIGPNRISDGKLLWTNRAGVTWTLIPDLSQHILRKEAGSTYQDLENGREFRVIVRNGEVDGFEFLGEFYQRDL